ncbi:hypothetical protein BDQ12DRAFT_673100 [Crucibulum laeve]|uniref:Mtf2-like C-terminal domain-containing protein n=1 Tax=Crucibulum laeve TaxID=68775 RepID=A0A5C3MII3_9AGAR|nr:hypothetical protein BDQ12DRAFT_673100 [Crucibulum laeve]
MLSRCSLPRHFPIVTRTFATSCLVEPELLSCSRTREHENTRCTRTASYNAVKRGYIHVRREGRSSGRIQSYVWLQANAYSTSPSSVPRDVLESMGPPDKLSWDHVFTALDDKAPLLPTSIRNPKSSSDTKKRGQRQTMTARELKAFADMFQVVFDANAKSTAENDVDITSDESTVVIGNGDINDLFGKLRRHSKKVKWTTEADDVLDRKKEAMDLCRTDQQLLEWAMKEVFSDSQKYEESARKAISDASQSEATQELPGLQPPGYSQLIALLMHSFRTKYHDPYLALSIFDYARNLSIASYVFGCSTQSYNELLITRWSCFRDLQGVYDALREMKVNGVTMNGTTRKIVENLRREIGEQKLWVEENEAGSAETWNMLGKIEELMVASDGRPSRPHKPMKWTDWRSRPLNDDQDDGWGFDEWDIPTERLNSRRRESRPTRQW